MPIKKPASDPLSSGMREDLTIMARRWHRHAKASIDPANGNASVQWQGRAIDACATELEALLARHPAPVEREQESADGTPMTDTLGVPSGERERTLEEAERCVENRAKELSLEFPKADLSALYRYTAIEFAAIRREGTGGLTAQDGETESDAINLLRAVSKCELKHDE